MNRTILREYNIDFEKGIGRCMGDADLYEQLLGLFLEDDCFQKATVALESGNRKELFNNTHELKGACGNAGLLDFFDKINVLVGYLRDRSEIDDKTREMFKEAEIEYQRAMEGVRKALND